MESPIEISYLQQADSVPRKLTQRPEVFRVVLSPDTPTEEWNAQVLAFLALNPQVDLTPIARKYDLSTMTLQRAGQLFEQKKQEAIRLSQSSGGGFFGDIGSFFGNNLGRVLTGLFTLGISEIEIGGQRIGQHLRLEPFLSTTASGGFKTTGAVSKEEERAFSIGGKVIAAAAVGSAAYQAYFPSGAESYTAQTGPLINQSSQFYGGGTATPFLSGAAGSAVMNKILLPIIAPILQPFNNLFQGLLQPLIQGIRDVLGLPSPMRVSTRLGEGGGGGGGGGFARSVAAPQGIGEFIGQYTYALIGLGLGGVILLIMMRR